MVACGGVAAFIQESAKTRNDFTIDFSQLILHFTEDLSGIFYVKSAVRFSQLISQKNAWGIACEIQGISTVFSKTPTAPPTHAVPKPPSDKKKTFQKPRKPGLCPEVNVISPKVNVISPKVNVLSPKVNVLFPKVNVKYFKGIFDEFKVLKFLVGGSRSLGFRKYLTCTTWFFPAKERSLQSHTPTRS